MSPKDFVAEVVICAGWSSKKSLELCGRAVRPVAVAVVAAVAGTARRRRRQQPRGVGRTGRRRR